MNRNIVLQPEAQRDKGLRGFQVSNYISNNEFKKLLKTFYFNDVEKLLKERKNR